MNVVERKGGGGGGGVLWLVHEIASWLMLVRSDRDEASAGAWGGAGDWCRLVLQRIEILIQIHWVTASEGKLQRVYQWSVAAVYVIVKPPPVSSARLSNRECENTRAVQQT